MSEFEKNIQAEPLPEKDNGSKYSLLSVGGTSVYMFCLMLLMFIVSRIINAGLVHFDLAELYATNSAFYNIVGVLFQIMYMGIPLLVIFVTHKGNLKWDLRLNPLSAKEILLLLIIGLLLCIANVYLTQLNIIIADLIKPIEIPAVPALKTRIDNLVLMVLMVVIAPIMEELTFRGVMQRGLEGKSMRFSIIVTGVFFGLLHIDYYSFVPKILAGIFICYIVYMTNSLYSGMILHIINNAISGLSNILLSGEESSSAVAQEPTAATIFMQIVMCLIIAMVIIFVIIWLTRLLKAGAEAAENNGSSVKKCVVRSTLEKENLSWYVYIPMAAAFSYLTMYIVCDVILP